MDECLDLHGTRIEEAKALLVDIYCYALKNEYRCIQVIFGKSFHAENRSATLKSLVIHWVRQLNQVVAYCQAPRSLGGEGAAVILLEFDKELIKPDFFDWK